MAASLSSCEMVDLYQACASESPKDRLSRFSLDRNQMNGVCSSEGLALIVDINHPR